MEVLEHKSDRILNQIMEEEEKKVRGKLKIFFGYAAGIGKTYAMLSAARREQKSGIDLVAGYVEPHARPETIAQLKGLEQIPPMSVKEKGIPCLEFDLDAALKRRPDTILIDEMAHTNASVCRHKKRYEDIAELLNAGINVYTTVNVQHIESLHDIVEGITGVSVRERIPDTAFDLADQIVMIDLSPTELMERLKDGKIYHQQKVEQALSHFFTIENLTALREVALRRMADWVNAERDTFTPSERSADSAEHIMMCLSTSPSNEKVIRQAARMANAFHGKFTAFYVETPDTSEMSYEDQKRLNKNTRMAEQLGAKIIISYGDDIVEQMAEYARVARVTKIVLGRTYTKRNIFFIKESFSERLVKIAPQLEIYLIPDSFEKSYEKKKKKVKLNPTGITKDVVVTTGIMVLATIVGLIFQMLGFPDDNLIMMYMIGVLFTSLYARYPFSSVLYGIGSILLFNYFFTDPKQTFRINDPVYIITLVVMFATSLIISTLVRKIKKYAKQAAEKSYRTEILLETSQKLQQAGTADEIAEQTVNQLGKLLNCPVYCFVGNPHDRTLHQYTKEEEEIINLPKEEIAVAQWVYKNNKHAGATTTTLPGAKCLYLAVRNGDQIFAVVGIELEGRTIKAFEKGIMLALLNESALAFEKEEVLRKEKETELRLEQEQLRANLLRAISHDLRTPLTSISGNADMLIESSGEMSETEIFEVYKDIYDDSVWLINLVENLLSVTRIENGSMVIHMQAELVDDVVTESLKHIGRHVEGHTLKVEQENDMLVARMDGKLIIQVITNLVDNALKYTPQGSQILLRIRKEKDNIVFEVADEGIGVPDAQKEKIFNLFYTGDQTVSDGRRGMGMGLSLCKSIIKAHGGSIWVKDRKPRGAVFGFTLKAEEVNME